MAEPLSVVFQQRDLLLELYREPSITAYNRLEARARTEDFERSLRAVSRDLAARHGWRATDDRNRRRDAARQGGHRSGRPAGGGYCRAATDRLVCTAVLAAGCRV